MVKETSGGKSDCANHDKRVICVLIIPYLKTNDMRGRTFQICHVCLKSRTTLLLNEKDTDSKHCSLLLRRSLGFEAGGEALVHRLLSKMTGKLDYILMSAAKLISVPPPPL